MLPKPQGRHQAHLSSPHTSQLTKMGRPMLDSMQQIMLHPHKTVNMVNGMVQLHRPARASHAKQLLRSIGTEHPRQAYLLTEPCTDAIMRMSRIFDRMFNIRSQPHAVPQVSKHGTIIPRTG